MRAYILNCENQIVGNPKGYKSMKTALSFIKGRSQAARKIKAAIYATFESRTNTKDNTLYTVTERN